MPHDAAYYREYRATRKALADAKGAPAETETPHRHSPSEPLESLEHRITSARKVLGAFDRPFVAWDGEGYTLPGIDTGLTPWEWNALVETTARERVGWSKQRTAGMSAAIHAHGGIAPAMFYERGRWKVRDEFTDLRPGLMKRNTARPMHGVTDGNVDVIADDAGVTIDELLAFAAAKPLTMAEARAAAEREHRDRKPVPGDHLYTILANSSGAYIEDPAGISTPRAFAFLRSEGMRLGNVTHTIFAGGYDANMTLGGVPRTALARLWAKGTVYAKIPASSPEWRIRYRPRKLFAVHALGPDRFTYDRAGRRLCDTRGGITLWDVFGFFQQSFVAACEANLSPEQLLECGLESIAAMKARRSTFTASESAIVRAYCFAEVRALVMLCDALREQLRDADLKVTRWDGAGAVSAALLTREGVKLHKDRNEDAAFKIATRTAYAGGRIETCMVGHANAPCVDDDIRSAYPAMMADLPTLADARWHHNAPPVGFYCARVRWELPHGLPWYPLFYRHPSGTITFPFAGEGWYWAPEVEAAQAFADLHGGVIDVRETYVLEPSSDAKPFAFVRKLYDTRALWQSIGRTGEKALKLALNGLYGKQAQQVGARHGEPPPFFQLEWAGFTTSATRARLVLAGMHDPGAVAMFATDGLFTTRALPSAIETEKVLGSWGRVEADDLVLAQAGVYWFRERESMTWTARSRGFDLRAMADPGAVLAAWKRGATEVVVPTVRFFTLGAALAGGEAWKAWRHWMTVPRVLDLTGTSEKRIFDRRLAGRWNPEKRLVPTAPVFPVYYRETGALSAAYPLRFERAALRDAEDVELEDIEEAAI